MTTPVTAEPEVSQSPLKRAVLFMTASSFLVPAAGLLTQPVLAQALGADGRGEMAAALAPAVLVGAVATLGLPEAVVYLTAKRSGHVRRSMVWAGALSAGLGVVCFFVGMALAPFLSKGNQALEQLILIALAMAIPTLMTGALRGVAIGHQMWRTVASESLLNTGLRVVLFVVLWLTGLLTPLTGVLVATIGPVVSGVVYWRLFRGGADAFSDDHRHPVSGGLASRTRQTVGPLVSYGSRVWFGAVAGMLVAKVAQTLMVPLSSTRDLGLYTVASTIADVPLVVAMAASGALQGVNSRSGDADQIATASRLSVLLSLPACVGLGATCPFWIPPLFGSEFSSAVVPTLMLLASAVTCVPGLMTGAGLSAAGRPGLRSTGFAVTLVITVGVFVWLVPAYGVIGACWTSLVSNTCLSVFMVVASSRVLRRHATRFFVPGPRDVRRVWVEGVSVAGTVLSRLPGRRAGASA